MMQVPDAGPFMRALLAVRLMGGCAVTYGVWVGVHPDDLQRAFRVWQEPDYENLRLEHTVTDRAVVCSQGSQLREARR